MKITEYKPSGKTTRDMTIDELKHSAKSGNIQAIKELVALKGGWASLTATQKDKVTQLLFGSDVYL